MTRVDYNEDPEGKLIVERIDPMDMRWDPIATKKGLADSRWRARLKKMNIEDVKARWPDKATEIAAYIEDTDGIDLVTHHNFPGDAYDNHGNSQQQTKDEVVVLQYQYWLEKQMAKVIGPDGQTVDMPADRIPKLEAAVAP